MCVRAIFWRLSSDSREDAVPPGYRGFAADTPLAARGSALAALARLRAEKYSFSVQAAERMNLKCSRLRRELL